MADDNILKKLPLWAAGGLIIAAVSVATTYLVCDNFYNNKIEALQEKITALQKTAEEAKVTQRISEQMEDIAFQQKNISDKQREAAEQQKKIADIERGKAEIERGLAKAAEQKAIASAAEAEQMRLLADEQREEAVRNMHAAELARAQTDTLYYLSLGASLAQSSTSFGNKVDNLRRLLAYASWYYTKEYGGDVYDENIFKALLFSSNNFERVNTSMQGNVRAIHTVTIEGKRWALGVTDYNEVFCFNTDRVHNLFKAPGYNFCDMTIVDDSRCATLTYDGKVTLTNYSTAVQSVPTEEKEIVLPKGQWRRIVMLKNKPVLACLSSEKVVWLDSKTLDIIAVQGVEGDPTAMELSGNKLAIFGKDDKRYYSEEVGVLIPDHYTTIESRVTAYHYIPSSQLHCFGTEDGTIYIASDSERKVLHKLTGHDGSIISLCNVGKYLVSISYDRRLRYWDVTSSSIIANFSVAFDKWPLAFDFDTVEDMLWVGNADGHVNRYCVNPNTNAQSVQNLLTEDFTKPDWERYIGAHIPFRSFLPKAKKEGGEQ